MTAVLHLDTVSRVHGEGETAVLVRELHHETRLEIAFEGPVVHSDRELLVPGHRRLQNADHGVEGEARLRSGNQRL